MRQLLLCYLSEGVPLPLGVLEMMCYLVVAFYGPSIIFVIFQVYFCTIFVCSVHALMNQF